MTRRLLRPSTLLIALGAVAGIVCLSGTASACAMARTTVKAAESCCPPRIDPACGCCPVNATGSEAPRGTPSADHGLLLDDPAPTPAAGVCDCAPDLPTAPARLPAERSGPDRPVDLVRSPDPIATPGADRPASDRPFDHVSIAPSSKIRLHLRLSHLLI